jgi:hypothetical protein
MSVRANYGPAAFASRSALVDDRVHDALGHVDHNLFDPDAAAVELSAGDPLAAVLATGDL